MKNVESQNVESSVRRIGIVKLGLMFAFLTCFFVQVSTECDGQDSTQPNFRLQSWQAHRKLAAESPYQNLRWIAMGPKFTGGRIESIDAPAGNLGTIYAGVGAGGVWRSRNGGLTWTPIFENESTFAIGDITLAPSNPQTLWVGTGECHLSGSSYPGTGVFKSTDGGDSWANVGLHESAHIGKIVVDPANEDVVYIAAMGRMGAGGQRGIFKTEDGGKTFKRILHEGDRVSFVDLVMDPNNSNRLFAAAWDRRGAGSRIFRSEDAGQTWQPLAGGLLEKTADRIAIDVSKSKPGIVYALMADRSSPELSKRRNASILFRSEDHGDTWQRTHDGYVPTYVGWDFCDLRVAIDDADHVYIGGLRLITSRDGGKTFEGEGGFSINKKHDQVFRLHHHGGIGMHLDVHDIWLDPANPERILLGNDGGLFSSADRGATWLHLNNLPIAEFYRIHIDSENPSRIWGGTQDNASVLGALDVKLEPGKEDPWVQVWLDPWSGGDGFATFPDPNDENIIYYTQQNGNLKRKAKDKRAKRIRPSAGDSESKVQFAWDTPFFASTHPGPTILYCASKRVLRSEDRGDTWKSISDDLNDQPLTTLVESPLDAKRLAAGDNRGRVFLSKNGGEHWAQAASLARSSVKDILLSAHRPNRVYAVLSGKPYHRAKTHLYLSEDFGQSWTPIAGNLPEEPFNTLVEHPADDRLLFAGSDLGVYVSTNQGKRWESLCDSLPTAAVVDLAIHKESEKLFAATHGLSIFVLDIKPILRKLSSE